MADSYLQKDGILISPSSFENFRAFEEAYLKVRTGELRVMSDDIVKNLPDIPATHPDHHHWKLRKHNIKRFLNYLRGRKNLKILDVGCGNGFLTRLMALSGHKLTGVDVNLPELKQAARVFADQKITWVYADIMKDVLNGPFDLIVFCSSIQYFDDLSALIKQCQSMLTASGEIHIIDSPFYKESGISEARTRSKQYYEENKAGDMAAHYHHHSWEELNQFSPRFLYRPTWLNKFKKDSPFCWIKISNQIAGT